MSMFRRVLRLGFVGVIAAMVFMPTAAFAGKPSPATVSPNTQTKAQKLYTCGGVLDVDYCLFWGPYQTGGGVSSYQAISNWSGWYFSDYGVGTGGVNQAVKNNANSFTNSNDTKYGCSYYNENYTGPYDRSAPRSVGQLVNTWNNEASFKWC